MHAKPRFKALDASAQARLRNIAFLRRSQQVAELNSGDEMAKLLHLQDLDSAGAAPPVPAAFPCGYAQNRRLSALLRPRARLVQTELGRIDPAA